MKARISSVLAGGLCCGAVLYGLPLAWMHLRLNHLTSSWDGAVVYLFFLALYGLAMAVACVAVALVLEGLARLRKREAPRPRAALLWGFLGFNLLFWELSTLYGRTYEETPFGTLDGLGSMMAFLLGAALVVALLVAVASWIFFRGVEGLQRKGMLRLGVGGILIAGLVAHLVAPKMLHRTSLASSTEEAGEQEITVEDTGLKVVLVGLDGADWRVMDPLLEAGRLPAFEALMKEGASGPLETIPDANSAVIWASMYSGRTPGVHTLHDFYRIELPGLKSGGLYPVHRTIFKELADLLDPIGLVRRTLVTRYALKAVPLWEILDSAGLTIGVVDGYLYSFPAFRPTVEGSTFLAYGADSYARSLSTRGSADLELFVQPKELFREVRDNLDGKDFEWQSKTLLQLLREREQPRFVNLYTHEPDSVQHQTWKWYEPEWYPGHGEDARQAAAIPEAHEGFDTFLGELRELVGPETVIVVASDHGHVPTFVHKLHTQHRHGPPGILLMAGGPVRGGVRLGEGGQEEATVYDLFPTLLYLLGLPVPEDGTGKVLLDVLDPAFVAQHPVRSIPSYDFLSPAAGSNLDLDDDRNRQELEKLKSLGYI